MAGNVDYIEVYEDQTDRFRWRAKAGNGEIVAQGESHGSRHDAERAALGVFPSATVVHVEEAATE